MYPDTQAFLEALFAPCEQGFMTFTAIHPDGQHPTPSRHVPVGDLACLTRTVDRLLAANRQGWGAYMAVATRKTNLGRWRRGGQDDLCALPALFVDIDRPPHSVLHDLRAIRPAPSYIVASGHGIHAYWLLSQPAHDIARARQVLHGLAAVLRGDAMSPAQSLRLPGTLNLKPQRDPTRCKILRWHPERRYRLDNFARYASASCRTRAPSCSPIRKATGRLNPRVVDALTKCFLAQGFKARGTWLSGPCVYPEHHAHGDARPSFGYNTATGYGFCHVCGTLLTKDICRAMGIDPADLGGLMKFRMEV